MSRALLANGRPIKRSQLRALKRAGASINVGFAPNTDRATGKLIKLAKGTKGPRSMTAARQFIPLWN